jgi:hypothetical protein
MNGVSSATTPPLDSDWGAPTIDVTYTVTEVDESVAVTTDVTYTVSMGVEPR